MFFLHSFSLHKQNFWNVFPFHISFICNTCDIPPFFFFYVTIICRAKKLNTLSASFLFFLFLLFLLFFFVVQFKDLLEEENTSKSWRKIFVKKLFFVCINNRMLLESFSKLQMTCVLGCNSINNCVVEFARYWW